MRPHHQQAHGGGAYAPARAPSTGGEGLTIPRDPLRISLFLYIIISIARVHQLIPGLAVLRPGLLLFGTAVGFAILSPKLVSWKTLQGSWIPKALIWFGILTVVSSAFGLSLGGSATFLMEDFSKILISTLVIVAAIRSLSDVWFFLWAYAISMALWVYMGFFVFETQGYGSATQRLSNLYTYDANDLGLILVMGAPFLVMLIYASKSVIGKLAVGGILVGAMATIAMTGSRGALVGLLGVMATHLLTIKEVSVGKKIGFVAVSIVALALAAPPGYWDQMSTLLNPSEDYNVQSVDGRMQIAERGFGYMLRYPLFGVGPANFGRAEMTISDKARDLPAGAAIRNIAPHNTFVQVGAELGFLGLGLWLYMLVRGYRAGAKLRKRMPSHWKRGPPDERFLYYGAQYFPIAFVGFALPSTFVSFAYLSPFFLLMAFYAGFARLAQARIREAGAATAAAPLVHRRRIGSLA